MYWILTIWQAQDWVLSAGVSSFNSHGIPKAIVIVRSILQMRNWGLWVKELAGTCLVQGLQGSFVGFRAWTVLTVLFHGNLNLFAFFLSRYPYVYYFPWNTSKKKNLFSMHTFIFFVLFWNHYSVLGSSRETEQIGDICIYISRTCIYIYLEQCGVRGTNAPMQ